MQLFYHLVLLAKNNEGYQNLIKIVSRGFTEGFYYKPRIDLEIFKTLDKDIIYEYSNLYKCKNVTLLSKYIRRM